MSEATLSVGDRPVYSAATFPTTVWSQFKLDLKERETNRIKCKFVQMAAAELLPNESHASANVSALAHLQKLSTATLKRNKTTITSEHKKYVEKIQ